MKRNDNIKIIGEACIKANPGQGGMHDQTLPSPRSHPSCGRAAGNLERVGNVLLGLAGFRVLQKMLDPSGDRGFESTSLHRCVSCELIWVFHPEPDDPRPLRSRRSAASP